MIFRFDGTAARLVQALSEELGATPDDVLCEALAALVMNLEPDAQTRVLNIERRSLT